MPSPSVISILSQRAEQLDQSIQRQRARKTLPGWALTLSMLVGLLIASCGCGGSSSVHPSSAPELSDDAPLATVELRPEGTGPWPIVIAIHGLGDTNEAYLEAMRQLGLSAIVVAPRAPIEWEGGYAWFRMRAGERETNPEWFREGVLSAAERVLALAHRSRLRSDVCGLPIVTGFSQGGMITLALAALHPNDFSSAVAVGGFLAEGIIPVDDAADTFRIAALNGVVDPLVVIEDARDSVDRLASHGHEINLREYDGVGHTLGEPIFSDLRTELTAAVQRACP